MFNIDFQYHNAEVLELHSSRLLASQLKKKDTGEILSRNFYKYEFKDDLEVKREEGVPPYFTGVLPDDPSTFTNPIEVDYYYKVRQPYTITDYEGYLMYGLPIENKNEYELKEGEIDPARINLFRGWFKRQSQHISYDYYIPVRTGAQFAWEEVIVIVVVLKPPSNKPSDFSDETDQQFQLLIEEAFDTLTSEGYTNATIFRNLPTSKHIRASKSIFNTGGVDLVSWSVPSNSVTFKFQNLDSVGLAFNLEIFNCSMWLSKDGIEKTKVVYENTTFNSNLSSPPVLINVDRDLPFVIIRPNLPLIEDPTAIWPGFKVNVQANQKMKVVMDYLGKFYMNYKDDFIDMDNKKEIIESPAWVPVNLTDPKPYGVNIPSYNFDQENTGWRYQARG